jgi:hypothetical protein
MSEFHPFNATGAPGSCFWCGRRLRQRHLIERETTNTRRAPSRCYSCSTVGPRARFVPAEGGYYQCAACGTEQHGERVRRVVSRQKAYDHPGDYGDGFFCGLRCAYQFAVRAAQTGTRLVRATRSA